jgi:hypothetical protein
MSRTDKTRPWWVRMADEPMVTCVPVHDHRFGECTLPGEITADSARPAGCHWTTSFDRIGRVDGAREWYFIRREDRRRSRRGARREIRRELRVHQYEEMLQSACYAVEAPENRAR